MITRIRDPFSSITHLGGALLGVVALVYLVNRALQCGNIWHIVSFAIFGASIILLYSSSAFYHMLHISDAARLVLRKIDHSMIFVLIAGSYTPFCLISLQGTKGMVMFGVVWGLVVVGILIKIFWIHAPTWLSTGIYLVMGWLALVVIVPLFEALSAAGAFWLVAGGLFYTVGAVIEALERPNPWPPWFGYHEIWHVFVLAGTASHFMSVNTLLT